MSADRSTLSRLEHLRKEAKSWLKQIRARNADAVARFRRALPDAPPSPGLRDVQHALARERGFDGWRALTASVHAAPPTADALSRDAAIAALVVAADDGQVARVRELLDLHPDIIDERGLRPGADGMRTALHFATGVPHEEVMRLLLDRGANPNIRDEGDWAYPLHFIAEKGRLDLVKLLIEHGADPIGTGDYHELDVIGWATAFDYVDASTELVQYLLAHGATHTIFSAVATGDVAAVRRLVAGNAELLERRMDLTNRRRKPLHLAVIKKQPEVVTALLELGADPNTLDESRLTPVDQAVLVGEFVMAEQMVERGAELTLAAAVALEREDDIRRILAKDPDGLKPGHRWGTLIIRASERSSGRVIETLLRLGASPNAVDDQKTSIDMTGNYTALHAAAWNGNLEAIRVLLAHGADPRTREDKYCSTPAGWANYNGKPEARDLILSGPIDIFEAIWFDRTDRVKEILRQEPGARDRPIGDYARCAKQGWATPLVAAVSLNRAEAVRILLAEGAVPITGPDGKTLHDIAREQGAADISALLAQSLAGTAETPDA